MGKAAHSDGLILACKLVVNHFLGPALFLDLLVLRHLSIPVPVKPPAFLTFFPVVSESCCFKQLTQPLVLLFQP